MFGATNCENVKTQYLFYFSWFKPATSWGGYSKCVLMEMAKQAALSGVTTDHSHHWLAFFQTSIYLITTAGSVALKCLLFVEIHLALNFFCRVRHYCCWRFNCYMFGVKACHMSLTLQTFLSIKSESH